MEPILKTILKEGRTIHLGNLSLKYLEVQKPSVEQKNRFRFVVSAKVAKQAVLRNLLKRRGRYIIRKFSEKIRPSFFGMFFFKSGSIELDFVALEKEILDLLSKAKIV